MSIGAGFSSIPGFGYDPSIDGSASASGHAPVPLPARTP